MIRALDVGRVSKLSSAYKFPVSKVDESTYLITDKDIHRCKACGETGTLSPKLWKKRRDCPDDFVYPNLCTPCYEHGREVPRWQRSEYLAAHPRPSIGASSSQSVLNVSGASTASSRGRATSSVSAAAVWPNDVSAAAALPNAQVSSPSAASVSATSTGLPSAQASPQVSSSAAASSVSAASIGSPSARASPRVSSLAAAASVSAVSPTVSNSVLTVGSGTGFDEEAVKRDLAIMEGVEEEDANKLRHWCEVRSLRDDIEKFPKDGKPSDLGVLFDDLGDLLDDMGDKIGSEKAYREGTRRAPACALCYYSLASALRGRNDLAGAERVLRKGIANSTEGGADPDICLLYSDLGAQLEDKGDKRGAELVYRAAFQAILNYASEYALWLEDEDDSYDKRPLEEKYPSLQKLVVSLSSRS